MVISDRSHSPVAMKKSIDISEEIKQLDIAPLPSSNREPHYIVSHNGRNYEVSKSVAELIGVLKENENIHDIIEAFSIEKEKDYSAEEIEQLITRFISPILNTVPAKSSYIWMRRELVSAKNLIPITSVLAYLFRPKAAAFFVLLITILQALFFYTTGSTTTDSVLPGLGSLLIYGSLFFLSVIFHELGHASACKYYNTVHGHIGFGVYLYFPVFYADVSNVWRLKRSQRVVVDLAGIYFQLIFLIPLIMLYFYSGKEGLKYLIYAINISFLFDLNPFFRFDGYWLITDLLGVSNLRKRTNQALVYLGKKLAGHKHIEKPYLFKVNSKEKFGFWIYVVTSNLFFGYYILYRLPLFMFDIFREIPGQISVLAEDYQAGNVFQFELFGLLLMQCMVGFLIIYMIFRISNNLVKILVRKSAS